MPVYSFYAVFEPDEGGYSVSFPDLEGCLTCGDDMDESLEMAQDALGGYLLVCEDLGKEIPESSSVDEIKEYGNLPNGAKLHLIQVNTDDMRESDDSTLLIPR
ncbi:type II toxin-antitoxin system HicB family antitoxin [Priestia aryabhattai]|uniref:type II toxin-antitoxin system HicB family antitoxin n=1 Tax=Priestia aryabhattai TaxID=412384 RepID=UPI00204023D7|nr:type II toxin-antitoxin system HicB family antitoxin [Priestia aryabhattai]MCM3639717.1 type II toxin-antitoxin system HicB family antitoxin [Priestia aryabhattai]